MSVDQFQNMVHCSTGANAGLGLVCAKVFETETNFQNIRTAHKISDVVIIMTDQAVMIANTVIFK